MKLFAYEKFKAQSEKKGPVGITRGLAAFIGAAEIVGGLGIVLKRLMLHGIAVDEKNFPLVIFREAHISATLRC